ncbi:hypothetical protein PAECIP111802_01522 [Paenibacillus allorhizosphaerae]|uniref:Uncharacterized protein n=1 Tax=Paenibacillus allorhizosphaerae TaxID=2849866 RepID=A0ABM8VDV6_9BACL|nr:hypothetical protein PAECIP111802_01522 [Paenibacillus allorhizosphaerae]
MAALHMRLFIGMRYRFQMLLFNIFSKQKLHLIQTDFSRDLDQYVDFPDIPFVPVVMKLVTMTQKNWIAFAVFICSASSYYAVQHPFGSTVSLCLQNGRYTSANDLVLLADICSIK